MKRGDVVLVTTAGDYGKPRPALVVQTDYFSEHPSVTLCLLTSFMLDAPLYRYKLAPTAENGLSAPSFVQVDKLMTVPRQKVGDVIGNLSDKQMSEITRLLALWIGIADR
ncbi:type II toxin-antitoxin system PemK/MazF family toxin [Geomonas oryzisoli]|uniref:Type II toxin-antitoxin system PemK/MazF family toxin n=1 Tax=Geomonas oryzisoli TaxID=2847992 RepID=A0ABX8J442_9BACT|nr:type II toxin-antitoxin system PemK/MazF family toxin [Geomonas oryzisoli]QWV93199.1 type II toxin-antitoxin system PemK/MazF family toxin [Geomonas oryzisoli]